MKAAINALTIDLATRLNVDIGVAKQFAETFFEDNADVFGPPVIVDYQGRSLGEQPIVSVPGTVPAPQPKKGGGLEHDTAEVAHPIYVPATGPDGLTAKQRAAVEAGVGLCSNCQQPKDDHLPSCAKASGMDKRAVTKGALPPAI